jgi:hypothetical protein
MKHYDYIEWVFYKEKVFPEDKINEMEEHLYICDECMDIFLSLIDEKEEAQVGKLVPINFTDEIINSIENIKYYKARTSDKDNKKFKDMFMYYVAVASVAVVLTLGGFYSGMVDLVSNRTNTNQGKIRIEMPNIIFDLSQNITDRASDFLNSFEISSIEEEMK